MKGLAMKIELTTQALIAVSCLLWLLLGGGAELHTEAIVLALLTYLGR